MTLDSTNVAFSTTWEIDQLVATGDVAVSGQTAVYTFSGDIPTFEVYYQPNASNYWYQAGSSEGFFKSFISANTLYVTPTNPGTARYYVWSDKVTN